CAWPGFWPEFRSTRKGIRTYSGRMESRNSTRIAPWSSRKTRKRRPVPYTRTYLALLTSCRFGDAEERFFDCASRPGDRYDRSPGKNKASGRCAPFLRQGRQNDVWRRGEKAMHEVPAKIRGCQQSQTGSSYPVEVASRGEILVEMRATCPQRSCDLAIASAVSRPVRSPRAGCQGDAPAR